MPPRSTRRAAAAAKSKITAAANAKLTKEVHVEDGDAAEGIVAVAVQDTAESVAVVARESAKPTLQFFKTFDTAAKLNEGLCVIRKLDSGRYEMVSLSSMAHEDTAFGSEEFGILVRGDQSGDRLKMLEEVEKTWKGAEFRVGQALSSASKLSLCCSRNFWDQSLKKKPHSKRLTRSCSHHNLC
jgi:hypothetical protein